MSRRALSEDRFGEAMKAALNPPPGPPEQGSGRVWLAVAVALACLLLLLVGVVTAQAASRPPWCTWPDDAGVAALNRGIDSEVAHILRHSPHARLDRATIQLGLMAQCASEVSA